MVAVKFYENLGRSLNTARRDLVRHNPKPLGSIYKNLREAFQKGDMRIEDLSIRRLFESVVPNGREMVSGWGYNAGISEHTLLAEAEAVKTSDFSNILILALSGQVMRDWELHGFLQDVVTETISTNLEMERIPGIGGLGDVAEIVDEGQPYPSALLRQQYVDTPPTEKRGFTVPVTKEAIFFDRTSVLLKQASDTRKWLMVNKEKRVLSVVAGITNTYRWNGNAYDTYQDGTPGTLFENIATSNGLTDWRSIYASELVFSRLRDPLTGEPINIDTANTILLSPELRRHAMRIIGATQVRHNSNENDGTENVETLSANPIGDYNILSSRYFSDQIGDTTSWIMGNFKRAFAYMQNWGITTDTAGGSSELGFHNDIVFQSKVSERGVAAVIEPRAVVLNTT